MSTAEKIGTGIVTIGLVEVLVSNRSNTAKVFSAASRFFTGSLSTAMGTSSGAVG